MEGVPALRQLIEKDDLICKLDLKDAYVVVPIHPSSKEYLSFRHKGTVYQYKSLAFGLSVAPRAFSKIMRYALEPLRTQGMRYVYYLDDICLLAKSEMEMQKMTKTIVHHLTSLNFSNQLGEEYFDSKQDSRISWFPVQLKDDANYGSCSKDEEIICEDTSSTREENEQIMQVDSQFVGEDDFDDTSDRRSSTSHQIPLKRFGQELKTQSSELGKSLSTVRRKYTRTKMVGVLPSIKIRDKN
ncbi:hypothetical protein G6F57_018121 [Rhizopus arrhizus]|uniref:Reverse transcriptase domain-containing protein n=1 Tax=Rhizopus oryzae TaxID=64495 RepID=A0A9P6WWQ5_RHIOR|nr:hypothetical protein G6F24_013711 [Rhizopus arrhizus]KAG1392442.1 hypothetical protein G6F58_012507 [Rhizopus delemar]KAG0772502.1 hypothetical protein G6F22_015688 [Rhizopus arrhizus]KAG0777602.1 hypothetical protein G6F21_013296 [Rhizopus arrhizus]KAG0803570.1 hypothetical protein G6F20_013412 [Rhizopus arrhizus]